MFKIALFSFFFFLNLILSQAFAKDIELLVLANSSDVSSQMSEWQLLTLNGYRQTITSELIGLKLDSELFWSKLDQKKMAPNIEAAFFQDLFSNVSISIAAPADPKAPKADGAKLSGNFKATLDIEKLKMTYQEIVNDLGETKLKSFYILANIDIDNSLTWEDLGVMKPESFRGVILDSWKKMVEKEIKGFDRIIVLEKDFSQKPDYMNPKSVTLKWTSTLRKVANNISNHSASFELSAEYVLQNSKSGAVLLPFDYPVQKRDFNIQNKKALSSALASLIYNSLLSQAARINEIVETSSQSLETAEVEIKIISKTGLTEIYQINSLLQDKFKDMKLTSQMKSYSTDGSTLKIRALGSVEGILDGLSNGGGKYPLNEQKVLIFNRADKTFAIIPKESNN